MKKINFKSVVKGVVLSPVYVTGFCYGICKHVADKINSKDAAEEVQEKLDQHKTANDFWQETLFKNNQIIEEHDVFAQSVENARAVGVPENDIIHNNDELDELLTNGRTILNGKEDTL